MPFWCYAMLCNTTCCVYTLSVDKKYMLKDLCHEIFGLSFIRQSTPSKALILGDIREYVLIMRYEDTSALCRISHTHDFALCRIAKNSDYAQCRIADNQHIFANISSNSKRKSKIFYCINQRTRGCWLMQKNRGRKSRHTVPLSPFP
jgi:hypothetical protein